MKKSKWYLMVALAMLGGLLLTACEPEVQTVVVTAPPEEVVVEVTVPPEVVVVTEEAEAGSLGVCSYNVYRMTWVMDYSDAENMLNVVFHPDSPFQYTFWDDQEFRDLVDQALSEFDPTVRAGLWQQAESILIDRHVAALPLFFSDRTGLVRPEIEFEFPPFGQAHIIKWALPEGQEALRWQLSTEPPTLDPSLATDTTSHMVINQLMEGLYRYRGDGTIEPAGAESYEVSDDGLVYTIYLREDATWSDGQPVTAQHYVDGLVRLMEPETAAEYAWLMYPVAGAEAFNLGETDDPSTMGVVALDDYTLEITLEQRASYFDSILAFSTTYPVRLDVIEQYGDLWTEPGNFIGNGPYVLIEWAHDDHVTVVKNPDYHSADAVAIETIEFPIITEDATSLAAYERGELDVSRYPSEELTRILEEMPDDFVRLPRPGCYYVGFNLLNPPTDNINLRMALSSAVDRRAILDSVLETPWRIESYGVIPPEIPGYQGDALGFGFDTDVAQQYLQAAMDEMGFSDPAEITLQLWFNRGNEDIMESVAEQWETNLGINVNVVIMEWGAYLDTLDECNNL
jgi:oligopeptide transport system substrate-binding protein